MSIIEKLGIEKCRGIVEGAPEWAIFWIDNNEYHGTILSFPNMVSKVSYSILDIKKAVEKYDSEHAEMIDYSQAVRVVEK